MLSRLQLRLASLGMDSIIHTIMPVDLEKIFTPPADVQLDDGIRTFAMERLEVLRAKQAAHMADQGIITAASAQGKLQPATKTAKKKVKIHKCG